MTVANEKETRADLAQVAEAGIQLPEPADILPQSAHEGQDHDDHDHGFEIIDVLRVVFVALAAAAVWFHLWEPFTHISVIGLLATLIGGYPIFKEAFENIIERRMTMELSMTIALVAALAIGEFFTALVITAFVLAAEILEGSRSAWPAGDPRHAGFSATHRKRAQKRPDRRGRHADDSA